MSDAPTVLTQAHDIIHQHIGPDGVNLEAADNHLTELEIPNREKMTILTRLSKLANAHEVEANKIALALIAANWDKGQTSDPRQAEIFPDEPVSLQARMRASRLMTMI